MCINYNRIDYRLSRHSRAAHSQHPDTCRHTVHHAHVGAGAARTRSWSLQFTHYRTRARTRRAFGFAKFRAGGAFEIRCDLLSRETQRVRTAHGVDGSFTASSAQAHLLQFYRQGGMLEHHTQRARRRACTLRGMWRLHLSHCVRRFLSVHARLHARCVWCSSNPPCRQNCSKCACADEAVKEPSTPCAVRTLCVSRDSK